MKAYQHFIVLFCSVWMISSVSAQQLTVEDCQEKARSNYPLINQFGLLEQSKNYTVSNISKNYWPQISLNGQASYQSDVTQVPVQIPGMNIPTIDKDQYKATVDVNQIIWDGGNVRSQRKIAENSNAVETRKNEVNLYTLRERINQLYFGILTIDEQLKQLDMLDENLQSSFKMVKALLQNGAGTQSDADAVEVEILNTEQKKTELKSSRKAYLEMLSAMINQRITEETVLSRPVEKFIDFQSVINRPEINLFASQRNLFNSQESMIIAKNRPKLSLFLQGGYGKPGLNMLSNEFDFFGIGGVRLSWNFGNLYTKSNEKKLIDNNIGLINTQEETFRFNTNLQLLQVRNEVYKAKELLDKDDEIIALRSRIKSASESKYENGVYTINDLIKDINAENQSRQAKILHEIQYLLSIYQYNYISGY